MSRLTMDDISKMHELDHESTLEIIRKLSAYGRISEDPATLTADLAELAHYKELKVAGRLPELPCKVGDTVYVDKRTLCSWFCFSEFKPYVRCKVIGIKLVGGTKKINLKPLTERTYGSRYHRFYAFTAIGKTIFLSPEAVEQALEK